MEDLRELAEIGLAMSKAMVQRISDPSLDNQAVAECALEFERVAQAVRLTIVLDARLQAQWRDEAAAGGQPVAEPEQVVRPLPFARSRRSRFH